MIAVLKEYVRSISIYDLFVSFKNKREYRRWLTGGKRGSPPHLHKKRIILEYAIAYNLKTLVETGTFLGEMVADVREYFDKIISIELSEALFERASKKFAKDQNIEIVQGDSAEILSQILLSLDKPALFWLDAHYSGGITAKGQINTPVYKELIDIFEYSSGLDVILIDDARMFVGENGYPDLDDIRDLIDARLPEFNFCVQEDIIRIYPVIKS